MSKRKFVDAVGESRCQATIILRDRSYAQCGRKATNGKLCKQHYKIVNKRK